MGTFACKDQRLRLPRVPVFLARIHMTWTRAWRLNRRPVTVRRGSPPPAQLPIIGPAHLPSAFLLFSLEDTWLPQPLFCISSLARVFASVPPGLFAAFPCHGILSASIGNCLALLIICLSSDSLKMRGMDWPDSSYTRSHSIPVFLIIISGERQPYFI